MPFFGEDWHPSKINDYSTPSLYSHMSSFFVYLKDRVGERKEKILQEKKKSYKFLFSFVLFWLSLVLIFSLHLLYNVCLSLKFGGVQEKQ